MTNDARPIVEELQEARCRFLALVAEIRPDLHRYCARMTGSVVDGEDVVQDTLARAYFELSGLKELPALRSWLFRIAHNRALDVVGRYERRMARPLDALEDDVDEPEADPADILARQQTVDLAVSRFLLLAPQQRSCVILKDVLDHSLEEIATLLDLSVPATKSALHRGRARLEELSSQPDAVVARRAPSAAIVRYAKLFNARDWDGVRAMLLDDVRLDVVDTTQRQGRDKVGIYFTNYARLVGWRVVPGWLDDREVLLVFRRADSQRPDYFVEIEFTGAEVAHIRDFNHVAYIARDAQLVTADLAAD
jgi:RNA polymerase sigma factor (sigma-70 family)